MNEFSIIRTFGLIGVAIGLLAGILYSFGGLIIDALVTLGWITSTKTPGLSLGTFLAFGALIGMPIIFSIFGIIIGALIANFKKYFYVLLIIMLALGAVFYVRKSYSDSKITKQQEFSEELGYEQFIKKNQQHSRSVSLDQIHQSIDNTREFNQENPEGRISDDLKQTIADTLNIDFLLKDIDSQKLLVSISATHPRTGYIEQELIFTDPQVGSFNVLMLTPDNNSPKHPAIISLHGHYETGQDARDKYFGVNLAQAGFVVILPTFRHMGHDGDEVFISENLYQNGFQLMGLRVYETHLIIKYLQNLSKINKIGIMGHSGGSTIASLVSRTSSHISAGVYDMNPQLLSLTDLGEIHCETLPELRQYKTQISDLSSLPFPTKIFEYGYSNTDSQQQVVNFFSENS